MTAPLLEVKNLSTSFYADTFSKKLVRAVDGVNFVLNPGETLGIVGESGCGKSVTALSILRLLPNKTSFIDKESKIYFNGMDLLQKSQKEMYSIRGNQIAMIFQDSMTSLNPVMTIEKQMMEVFQTHQKISKKDAYDKSLQMLKKVGIPSPETRMKCYPHELSGGMRQRILIAMALSCDPKVLIADEPTTALDVTIQAQILDLMRELKHKIQTSIILITHDMGVVAEMADHILIMYGGNVMEYANAADIFANPLHPYTKGLLASIPRLDKKVDTLYAIPGSVPNLSDMPSGCRFCDRCEHATDRCKLQKPPVYLVKGRKVRCYLYETVAEEVCDE
jgi:peptide/nickel transport system ATP-binding protein